MKRKSIALSVLSVLVIGLLSCTQPVKKAKAPNYEKKIDSLISLMTLKEKVGMIHANSSFTSAGVPRLGIPEWVMSDGPHGVRPEHGRGWNLLNNGKDSSTYLPTGITLASTWNTKLGYEFGKVLGSEANARGKDNILGPGVCIIRTPLNGRNFEYLSEDPYLDGQMAVGYIKGVQSQDVAACVKHYLANNQETNRTSIDVEMSERALREIYLPAFKAAVEQGKVYTLMGAYNKFRGQFCTENKYLVKDILKGEFGFKGIVMSDWGAVHNTMDALMNGTDLEMGTDLAQLPNPDYSKFFMGDTVIGLVKSGKVPVSVINDKVHRILRVMYKTHVLGGGRIKGERNTPEHQAVALKVAEEGIVLLKNQDHVLPLKENGVKSVAVIGANAVRKNAMGGGSSQVRPPFEVTPLEGIQHLLGNNVKVKYAEGYKVARGEKADPKLIAQAVKAAKSSDEVILVGGWIHGYGSQWSDNAYDSEGVDKPNMQLPFGQNELIQAVLKANPNTIIVMMGGGPMDMTTWVDQAKGIIEAWYPGMYGGKALAEILYGKVNPSGKLPVTFPKKLSDTPVQAMGDYPGKDGKEVYKEGIFVGYRYYDTYNVTPQFCFGHGLSYTTFKYDSLQVTPGDKQASVKLKLTNTGKMAGAEVVEVYVHQEKSELKRPEKELKAFTKVFLQPGQSQEVELTLPSSAFKYYNDQKHQWVLEPGKFDILVGSSSRDIRQTGTVTL